MSAPDRKLAEVLGQLADLQRRQAELVADLQLGQAELVAAIRRQHPELVADLQRRLAKTYTRLGANLERLEVLIVRAAARYDTEQVAR